MTACVDETSNRDQITDHTDQQETVTDQEELDENNTPEETSIQLNLGGQDFYIEDQEMVLRVMNKLIVDEANGSRALNMMFDAIDDPAHGSFNLTMRIKNWDWQKPPQNGIREKSYDAYTTVPGESTTCSGSDMTECDQAHFTLIKLAVPDEKTGGMNQAMYEYGTTKGGSSGTVTITNVDTENKTISGRFNNIVFRRGMFDEESVEFFPETVKLKGGFEDVPYGM